MAKFKTGDTVLNTKTNKAGYIAFRTNYKGVIDDKHELVKFPDGQEVILIKYLKKIKVYD
jgi:hypothetical protein